MNFYDYIQLFKDEGSLFGDFARELTQVSDYPKHENKILPLLQYVYNKYDSEATEENFKVVYNHYQLYCEALNSK